MAKRQGKDSVIIIGSGGQNKFGFLKELQKLGKNVVLLDAKDNAHLKYPKGVETIFLPSLDKNTVMEKIGILEKTYNFTAVGTIFEHCIETAALVREHLCLPGFSYKKTLISRNKILMMDFLKKAGVRIPAYEPFVSNMPKKDILKLAKNFNAPFILKLAMGSANVGLRLVRAEEDFWHCYQGGLQDAKNYHLKKYELNDWSKEWLISEYIGGKEIEADMYIEEGKIRFKAIQEKTLIFEHGEFIDENNAVIPALTLTNNELAKLDNELNKLAKAVWEHIAKPCGVKYFPVYSEFRIDKDGKPYCLEFTLRIGGALMPLSVLKSTGVNTFEIAARSLLGLKTSIPSKLNNRGVCWQILFSDRLGIYCGIGGVEKTRGLSVIPFKRKGTAIKTPQSEYLCCIFAEARTSKDASNNVATALNNAHILVKGNSGRIDKVEIPVTNFY